MLWIDNKKIEVFIIAMIKKGLVSLVRLRLPDARYNCSFPKCYAFNLVRMKPCTCSVSLCLMTQYGFNSVRLRRVGKHYVVIIEKRIAFTLKIQKMKILILVRIAMIVIVPDECCETKINKRGKITLLFCFYRGWNKKSRA